MVLDSNTLGAILSLLFIAIAMPIAISYEKKSRKDQNQKENERRRYSVSFNEGRGNVLYVAQIEEKLETRQISEKEIAELWDVQDSFLQTPNSYSLEKFISKLAIILREEEDITFHEELDPVSFADGYYAQMVKYDIDSKSLSREISVREYNMLQDAYKNLTEKPTPEGSRRFREIVEETLPYYFSV